MAAGSGGRSRSGDGRKRRGLDGARPRGLRVCPAAVVAAVAAVLVSVLAMGLGVRVNTSGSLPVGVYRVGGGPIRRGSLVLLCPPVAAARLAWERGYLPAGGCAGGVAPLGKMVVAVAGDWVEMSGRGVAVNGVAIPESRGQTFDSAGRPVPRAFGGRRRMGRREVWVYAPHARSFDSRVFGPVAVGSVLGRLEPVLAGRSRRLAATAAAVGRIGARGA
jgi:conjugative transfer signal peptidase TraF